MAAPKGHEKWGGRVKGTPNKSTSELLERCRASGADPFEVMIEMLKDPKTDVRFNAAKELCQYIYAKRRAMDMNVNQALAEQAEEYATLTDEQQIEIMEQEIKRLKGA